MLIKKLIPAAAMLLSGCGGGDYFTVSTNHSDGGTATPKVQSIAKNSPAEVLLTAEPGFAIDTVSGCDGTLSGNVYQIPRVTSNCQVAVNFKEFYLDNRIVGRIGVDLSFYRVNDTIESIELDFQLATFPGREDSFSISPDNTLSDEDWILVKVSGGEQMDADYDGANQNNTPTPYAESYAFTQVKGLRNGIAISELSDIAWRLTSDYVGTHHINDVVNRYNEAVDSLFEESDNPLAMVFEWELSKRKSLTDAKLWFSRDDISYSGSNTQGAFSYLEAVDAGMEHKAILGLAYQLVAPTLLRGVNVSGKDFNKTTLFIFGPGNTSSSTPEFNLGGEKRKASIFTPKSNVTHTIIAEPLAGAEFSGWHGCPKILDDQSCEVTGEQPYDIYAHFSVTEKAFTTPTFEIPACVNIEEVSPGLLNISSDDDTCMSISDVKNQLANVKNLLYTSSSMSLAATLKGWSELDDSVIQIPVEPALLEDIIISGTFKPSDSQFSFEFVDEQGKAFTASHGEQFDLYGFTVRVEDNEIVYTNNSCGDGAGLFNCELSLIYDTDISRSSFSVLENFDFFSADLIIDVTLGIKAVGEIQPFAEVGFEKLLAKKIIPVQLGPIPLSVSLTGSTFSSGNIQIDSILRLTKSFKSTYTLGASITVPWYGALPGAIGFTTYSELSRGEGNSKCQNAAKALEGVEIALGDGEITFPPSVNPISGLSNFDDCSKNGMTVIRNAIPKTLYYSVGSDFFGGESGPEKLYYGSTASSLLMEAMYPFNDRTNYAAVIKNDSNKPMPIFIEGSGGFAYLGLSTEGSVILAPRQELPIKLIRTTPDHVNISTGASMRGKSFNYKISVKNMSPNSTEVEAFETNVKYTNLRQNTFSHFSGSRSSQFPDATTGVGVLVHFKSAYGNIESTLHAFNTIRAYSMHRGVIRQIPNGQWGYRPYFDQDSRVRRISVHVNHPLQVSRDEGVTFSVVYGYGPSMEQKQHYVGPCNKPFLEYDSCMF